MAYDTLETSIQDAEPIETYTFKANGISYGYTSSDADIQIGSIIHTPAAIKRSVIEQGSEMNRSDIKVSVALDNPVATLFMIQPPSDIVSLTITRIHRGDTESKVIWVGRVLGVRWTEYYAEMTCEAVFTSLKRPGLRRVYSYNCPHQLYGVGCFVNELSYKVTDDITVVSGSDVTVPAASGFSDGYFDGGFLHWISVSGKVDNRMIITHVGSILTLATPIYGMAPGDTADLYPGCAHDLSTCDTKFSNALNYGGFPYVPDVNPFGGSNVF